MNQEIIKALNSKTTEIKNAMSLIELGLVNGWMTDIGLLDAALSQIQLTLEERIFPFVNIKTYH